MRSDSCEWRERVTAHVAAERARSIVKGEDQVEDALGRAKEHDRKAAECEAQLAKVEKAIASLQKQKASVRERILGCSRNLEFHASSSHGDARYTQIFFIIAPCRILGCCGSKSRSEACS